MKIKNATVFYPVLLMMNILVLSASLIYSAPGGGNLVTCYSTFEIGCVEENRWEVYDCGSCTKKNCKSYSDRDDCSHSPTADGNVNLN